MNKDVYIKKPERLANSSLFIKLSMLLETRYVTELYTVSCVLRTPRIHDSFVTIARSFTWGEGTTQLNPNTPPNPQQGPDVHLVISVGWGQTSEGGMSGHICV